MGAWKEAGKKNSQPFESSTASVLKATTPSAVEAAPLTFEKLSKQEYHCPSNDGVSTCFAREEKSEYNSAMSGLWKCFCCLCNYGSFNPYLR